MNGLKAGLALAIGGLMFSSAQADIVLQNCNGCSTAQVEALAPNCAQGYAYVSDLVSQNLYKICFNWDVDDGQRPFLRYKDYSWAHPEDNAQQTWQAYEDIYLNDGHKMAADISIRVNVPPSMQVHGDNGKLNAYDTIVSTANNDAVIHYLDTTYFTTANVNGSTTSVSPALAAAFARLLDHLQVTTPLITTNPNFPVTIIVVFSDGSKRAYSFNYTVQQYAAVPSTARDGHGNLIPENTSMASNGGSTETYGFNGAGPSYDQGNLESLLQRFGAHITGGSGGFVTCSWDGAKSSLTCDIHQF